MIIGNGLMATTFNEFSADDSVVIFASGVSNSLETSNEKYEREKKLLRRTIENIDSNSTIVYFSTCSIFDSSLNDTPYIIHKKEIEKYISNNVSNYIIFRLPSVISHSNNPNTLINFLFNKIKREESFQLHSNAFRYLIDIEDVYLIISPILKKKVSTNSILNIALSSPIRVIDIVKFFENIIGKKSKCELTNKGARYNVNNTELLSLLPKIGFNNPSSDYYETAIYKYFKNKIIQYDI